MIFIITSAIWAGFTTMVKTGLLSSLPGLVVLMFHEPLLEVARIYLPEQVVNWLGQFFDRLRDRKLRTFGWLFCAGFVLALLNLMM